MKKAFTLIEMLVSITLFSVILVFLYQLLDTTKIHNQKYDKQVAKKLNQFDVEFVIFLDMANKTKIELLQEDRDGSSILQIDTKNTYHNPFYTKIAYFLTRDNELFRVESQKSIKFSNISDSLDTSYVDLVDKNIKKFKVSESKDRTTLMFYIEYNDGHSLYFPIKTLI